MKNNIPIALKPKAITKEVISAVISMAYKGFHRKAIAREFRISAGSIEQIIASEEGLVKKRKHYKYQSKKRRHKAAILRAMRDNPSALKQDIKHSCYAAFHWLYVHDKCWLNNTLPVPTRPKLRPKVDWHERDVELSSKVKSILLKANSKMSRTSLDKELGEHGWLTRMQHKLPLTMATFQMFNSPNQI